MLRQTFAASAPTPCALLAHALHIARFPHCGRGDAPGEITTPPTLIAHPPGSLSILGEDVSVGEQTSSFESYTDILAALLGLDGGARH